MAILIPEMEMPKTCMECELCYDMMGCMITGTRFWRDALKIPEPDIDPCRVRLSDCPLVEVDIDIKLFTVLAKFCKEHTYKEFSAMFGNAVICKDCIYCEQLPFSITTCHCRYHGHVFQDGESNCCSWGIRKEDERHEK